MPALNPTGFQSLWREGTPWLQGAEGPEGRGAEHPAAVLGLCGQPLLVLLRGAELGAVFGTVPVHSWELQPLLILQQKYGA